MALYKLPDLNGGDQHAITQHARKPDGDDVGEIDLNHVSFTYQRNRWFEAASNYCAVFCLVNTPINNIDDFFWGGARA